MSMYAVKEVPDIILKYKDENGNNKSLKLDYVKDYIFDYKGDCISINFTLPIFEKDLFDVLRKKIINNKYYEVSISATNIRRSTNGTDEEYVELDETSFNICGFSYSLSADGEPALLNIKLFKEL